MSAPWVIHTSVVVRGLLTADGDAPTARILDAMVAGRILFLLSVALLAEYRDGLLRPRIRERHGLDEPEIDPVLTEITAGGRVRESGGASDSSPDPGDQHLWDLLAAQPDTVRVTGDRTLLAASSATVTVLAPWAFVARFLTGMPQPFGLVTQRRCRDSPESIG